MKLTVEQKDALNSIHAFDAWPAVMEVFKQLQQAQVDNLVRVAASDAAKLTVMKARVEGGQEIVDGLNAVLRKLKLTAQE